MQNPTPTSTDTSVNNETTSHIAFVAEIAAAFVANNTVRVDEIPGLIASIDGALRQTIGGETQAEPAAPAEPAVPIRKSITQDYLICLEDGRKFKSLKRHLRTKYDMSPEDYRAKWGLPRDYPMVAPNYAKARSELAKNMGLGRKPGESPSDQAARGAKAEKKTTAKKGGKTAKASKAVAAESAAAASEIAAEA